MKKASLILTVCLVACTPKDNTEVRVEPEPVPQGTVVSPVASKRTDQQIISGFTKICQQNAEYEYGAALKGKSMKVSSPASIQGEKISMEVSYGDTVIKCSDSVEEGEFEIAVVDEKKAEAVRQQQQAAIDEENAVSACKSSQLVIESWSWFSKNGYAQIVGEVTNNTDSKIDNIVVNASMYSADGTMIDNGEALLQYKNLMPGQTSPFKAFVSYNPLMETAKVEFSPYMGDKLSYVERKNCPKS